MLKMDRYTDKKITSIAIQLEKLGIDFIHFYKYDFASNHIGKEPGVEIDWFFQNSILFTETVHKFPDELNIEEFIYLYKKPFNYSLYEFPIFTELGTKNKYPAPFFF